MSNEWQWMWQEMVVLYLDTSKIGLEELRKTMKKIILAATSVNLGHSFVSVLSDILYCLLRLFSIREAEQTIYVNTLAWKH
jgi:hypothetical protein